MKAPSHSSWIYFFLIPMSFSGSLLVIPLMTYGQGLNPALWLQLNAYGNTMGLEQFIQMSIRVIHSRESTCLAVISNSPPASSVSSSRSRVRTHTSGCISPLLSRLHSLTHTVELRDTLNPRFLFIHNCQWCVVSSPSVNSKL